MAETNDQRVSRVSGFPQPFGVAAAAVVPEHNMGAGAPSKPNGVNPATGDYWFRTDTPSTANQRIYICTAGGSSPTWVGIV
jgi:hypothetical protein